MNKPRCKKCNRPLRDPVSVACGVGPECRGDTGRSHKTGVKSKRGHAAPYIAAGQSAKIGGVIVARTPDGWTVNGKDGPLAEAWLKKYMPSVLEVNCE